MLEEGMRAGRTTWLCRCGAAWLSYARTEKARRDMADYLRAAMLMAAVMTAARLVLWWYSGR